WDLIRMLIFFKRGRLREFASGRQRPGERKRRTETRSTLNRKTDGMTEGRNPAGQRNRIHFLRRWHGRVLASTTLPALLLLAGCGGVLSGGSSSGSLSISPGTATIDANCTGCNTTTTSGGLVEQFSATFSGSAANVTWTVSGGDANSGPGAINSSGQYTPPAYLTTDRVEVRVTAELASSPS